MNNHTSQIAEKLDRAGKVALLTDTVNDGDRAHALVALYKYISEKGKEVHLVVANDISPDATHIFKEAEVSTQNEIQPVRYVVSIDYGRSDIEKVSYEPDEETGKLNFYIIPSNGDFDFDNVEYSSEGNNYDLTITVGINSFKDLGQLYENNRKLFSDVEVISIVQGDGTLGDISLSVPENSSLMSAVRQFIGGDLDPAQAQVMLQSLVRNSRLIEGEVTTDGIKEMSELVDSGADLTEAIQTAYFSKSYPNLDLQIKLMHNIQIDRGSRVIWSKLSYEEVKFCGINRDNIDLSGRIPFNTSREFDLAFAVYEIEKDKLIVVVESNAPEKYSAQNIAEVFGGSGDNRHATFEIENMPVKNFDDKVFMVLNDIYEIRVNGKSVDFRAASAPSEEGEKSTPPTVGKEK